jgi:hypothetical protein
LARRAARDSREFGIIIEGGFENESLVIIKTRTQSWEAGRNLRFSGDKLTAAPRAARRRFASLGSLFGRFVQRRK